MGTKFVTFPEDAGKQGDGAPVTVAANPKALAFYEAFKAVQEAEATLEQARRDVPDYTGQWDPRDYYRDQENAFNEAVNHLGRVMGL